MKIVAHQIVEYRVVGHKPVVLEVDYKLICFYKCSCELTILNLGQGSAGRNYNENTYSVGGNNFQNQQQGGYSRQNSGSDQNNSGGYRGNNNRGSAGRSNYNRGGGSGGGRNS